MIGGIRVSVTLQLAAADGGSVTLPLAAQLPDIEVLYWLRLCPRAGATLTVCAPGISVTGPPAVPSVRFVRG